MAVIDINKRIKQQYSTNGINASTAGKRGGTTATGKYKNGRQTMTDADTGKVGRKGQMVTRRKQDYDIRVGMNNDQRSPEAIQRLRDMGIEVTETTSRVTTG